MSELIPGAFSSYALSELEQMQGSLLTPYNVQVLQNIMAESAGIILELKLPTTPEEQKSYEHQLIYSQARVALVKELLAFNATAEEYFRNAHMQQNVVQRVDNNLFNIFGSTDNSQPQP